MKFRFVKIIILLTAVSLVGLILMQLFWIKNAVSLAEEQFDNRVAVALKSVVKSLEPHVEEVPMTQKKCCEFSCDKDKSKCEYIPTDKLDSLLKVTFLYHHLDTVFEYSIIKSVNDSLLFAKRGIFSDPINLSCHKTGLTCFKSAGSHTLNVFFPNKRSFIIVQVAAWLFLSIVFLAIVIFSFAYIVLTIIKQKKLAEMKNDFINNMTHELKTPISTISMISEVLLKGDQQMTGARLEKYARIIFEENSRLHNLVNRVLKISEIDKNEYSLTLEPVEMHMLVKSTVEKLCLDDSEKKPEVIFNLVAKNDCVIADREHIINVINNLLDNAMKYSGDRPVIVINSQNDGHNFVLSVKDNGIGIKGDRIKHVFEKFYRVPTGNVHNVKGFGLGLYYVKTIIEMQSGSVSAKSEFGKGSEFFVSLPLK